MANKRKYTDEERYERHLEAMKKYQRKIKNGDKIRRYGNMTEEEKYESHRQAMKKYYEKKKAERKGE